MEPKTQVVSGLCFYLILHKETLLSQTRLVLGLKAELPATLHLHLHSFVARKRKISFLVQISQAQISQGRTLISQFRLNVG